MNVNVNGIEKKDFRMNINALIFFFFEWMNAFTSVFKNEFNKKNLSTLGTKMEEINSISPVKI